MVTLPVHLLRDRYWASMLHLFINQRKLKSVFTTKYFDLDSEMVHVHSLKRTAGTTWSHSEKIMLRLALHLFNEQNKFNLSDLDYLDDYNRKLAYEAIRIRFGN